MSRILKAITLCILTILLIFIVTACKGNAAKKVDELIQNIGTVTTESKEAIDSAKAAYDELSDEEKSMVTEYELLQKATSEYEKCLLIEMLEKDEALSQKKTFIHAVMNKYFPKFTFDADEKVLYFEITTDQDSTDAIMFYPLLSSTFFDELKNNMCSISSQIYEITQQYEVDSVVIVHGYRNKVTLLEIKNGETIKSIM